MKSAGRLFDMNNKECMSVVFLYHRLGTPKLSSLVAGQYVRPNLFRSQLDHLAKRGWKASSLSEMLDRKKSNTETDSINRFAITFDDGYRSVYEHAYPILAERGLTGTIYIVADCIGGINEWDRRAGDMQEEMMTADQIREMSDNGFEIGSHTLTHPRLSNLSDEQLEREIRDSKHKLEDIIGRKVVSFSYPYGDYDNRAIEVAKSSGYENAVSTKLGVLIADCNPYEIPRINVRWNALGVLLMRKIQRARKASGMRV